MDKKGARAMNARAVVATRSASTLRSSRSAVFTGTGAPLHVAWNARAARGSRGPFLWYLSGTFFTLSKRGAWVDRAAVGRVGRS